MPDGKTDGGAFPYIIMPCNPINDNNSNTLQE